MGRFAIHIGRRWRWDPVVLHRLESSSRERGDADMGLIRDAFEILLDGRNLAGEAEEDRPFLLLRELLRGVAALLEGKQGKVIVPFHDSPWEMVLTRRGLPVLLSFYGIGLKGEVMARNVALPLHELLDALQQASAQLEEDLLALPGGAEQAAGELRSWSVRLDELRRGQGGDARAPQGPDSTDGAAPARDEELTAGSPEAGATLTFAADDPDLRGYDGTHPFDLHALLFPGELAFSAAGTRVRGAGRGFPFLALTRLVEGLERMAEGAREGENVVVPPFHDGSLRYDISSSGSAVRLQLCDRLTAAALAPPLLFDLGALGEVLLSLGSALARRVVELNPRQQANQRLRELVEDLELGRRLLPALHLDQRRPDRRGIRGGLRQPTPSPPPPLLPPVVGEIRRLRYVLRWEMPWLTALPPTSLGLTGGRLLAASPDRVALLDRATGGLVFDRRDAEARLSLSVAGDLLLVLDGAGRLQLHDFSAPVPRPRWRVRGLKRGRLSPLGATVWQGPGEQRLLLVHLQEEGLCALELDSGRIVWREPGTTAGPASLAVSGPLLFVAEAEKSIRACLAGSGEPVWLQRLPFRPSTGPLCVHDRLVLAGGERRGTHAGAVALDAATGEPLWQAALGEGVPRGPASDGQRLFFTAPRGAGGLASALDLSTGEPVWRQGLGGLGFDGPAAPLFVGDRLILRTDHGLVCAVAARDGTLLWSRDIGQDAAIHLTRSVDLLHRRGLVFGATDMLHVLDPETGRHLGSAGLPGRTPELLAVDDDLHAYLADEEGVYALRLLSVFGVL